MPRPSPQSTSPPALRNSFVVFRIQSDAAVHGEMRGTRRLGYSLGTSANPWSTRACTPTRPGIPLQRRRRPTWHPTCRSVHQPRVCLQGVGAWLDERWGKSRLTASVRQATEAEHSRVEGYFTEIANMVSIGHARTRALANMVPVVGQRRGQRR